MSTTTFRIKTVEAFHVVVRDRPYWGGLSSDDRISSERYTLKAGWRAVYGRNFETSIIKVTLEDGAVGWGEATEPICPEVICRLAVELISPFIGDREYDAPASAWNDAYELQRVRGHSAGYVLHAMAAIDMAVWDALAQRASKPLCALLRKQPAKSVPVYLSGIRRGSQEERIALLSEHVASGLCAVKLFVNNDTAETLNEIHALRSNVPGDWCVMVDALWSYESVDEAANARAAFGDQGVQWLECPIIPEDLEAHRAVAKGPGAPIALGEHFFTHHQSHRWLQSGVMTVFQPDLGRTGISNGMLQSELAHQHGVQVTPHMGSGSPIVQAAALHFWACLRPNLPCEYQLDLSDVLSNVVGSEWTFRNGSLEVPNCSGLGVRVDEDKLTLQSAAVERWSAPS